MIGTKKSAFSYLCYCRGNRFIMGSTVDWLEMDFILINNKFTVLISKKMSILLHTSLLLVFLSPILGCKIKITFCF